MALKYFSTVADSCHGHARTLTTALLIVFCSIALSTGLLRKRALLLVRVCLIHDRYQPLAKPLTRRFPKLMRERESFDERKERCDVTIALRFFVFHYPLVLFLHLFFFLFHAHCVVDARFYGSVLRGFQSRRDSASYLGFYFI